MRYKILLVIPVLLFIHLYGYSQSADEIAGRLMNEYRMFELKMKYEQIKDELNPVTNNFARAMLADAFNEPRKGIVAVDNLLENKNYRSILDINNTSYLVYLKSSFLGTLGMYEESAELLSSFLNATEGENDAQGLKESMKEILRENKILAEYKKMKVKVPGHNVEVPFVTSKSGKGVAIDIRCNINGKPAEMCLDTGCPNYSLVTDKFAKDYGIKEIVDSIPIGGIGNGFARIGIAKSFSLGDIKFRNVLFYIVDKISPVDTISLNAVFGAQILNELGEFQIFPQRRAIMFPVEKTQSRLLYNNMMMKNRHLFMNLKQDGKNCNMHFDTGASVSNMSYLYFSNNKEYIEKTGQKDSIRLGGFGGISKHVGYKLPSLDFKIGDVSFEMENLPVHTIKVLDQAKEDGSFGADFLLKFKKVIVSYKNMFIEVEK